MISIPFARLLRAPILGLISAVLFLVGTSLGAAAATTLYGETFTWTGVGTNGSFFCSGTTSGSMSYSARGTTAVATGPNPGTFRESGQITFSGGVITGWAATFRITSGTTTINGSKALLTAGPASCNPGGPSCLNPMTGSATATLSYTTTTPFVETGNSLAVLHGVLGCNDSITGSTFSETFGPAVQPGCNTNTNGQGNDECDQ
ncbi:MAG: hypothetical protein M3082_10455 [Candidatus Dormibacteraeota bacterium]|nr:hypothetical protein [Candidatus Dormibacteraeota bacterium]